MFHDPLTVTVLPVKNSGSAHTEPAGTWCQINLSYCSGSGGWVEPALISVKVAGENYRTARACDCQLPCSAYDARRLYAREEVDMAKRAKTKRAKTTRAKKSRSGRGRDRKLVAGGQKHEVRYAAKKAGVKGRAVKKAVKRVGHRRTRVEQVLAGARKAVKRVAQAPAKAVEALSSGDGSGESSSPEPKSES
jgi:hypothetical protein